jgi:hypothetical protein
MPDDMPKMHVRGDLLLLCFGFYNVAPDADLGVFTEAERRNAAEYRAGCRTFGWECLGNYTCAGQPPGSWPFGYVHAYVIEGSDPAEAMRAQGEAMDPPGFAEIVAEGRAFMTSQDDTAVVWLHADGDQPSQPTPLEDRCIVVRLHNGAQAREHAGHAGWLGRFRVEGAVDADGAEICVHARDDGSGASVDRGWLLRPVASGREVVPPLG